MRDPLSFRLVFTPRLLLLLLIGLAFALRLAWLDRQGLWTDEWATLRRAEFPFERLWRELPPDQTPLYFLLVRRWTRLTGTSDFALRFFSVGFGLLAVPLLYQLGRRLVSPSVALLAAGLLALNPFHIWYSQEARMYTQLTALGLVVIFAWNVFLTSGTHRGPPVHRQWAWWVYVIGGMTLLYTHYYGVLILLIVALYTLGHDWLTRLTSLAPSPGVPGSVWRPWLLANIVISLAFVPWLHRLPGLLQFTATHRPDPVSLTRFAHVFAVGIRMPSEADPRLHSAEPWLGLIILFFFACGVVALIAQWRQHGQPSVVALTLAALIVPSAVVLTHHLRNSYYHPRYFFILTPFFCLVLAQGLFSVYRQQPMVGRLSLACLLSATVLSLTLNYTEPLGLKSRDQAYMARILLDATPDDALLLVGLSTTSAGRYGSASLKHVISLDSQLRTQSPAEVEAFVAQIAKDHPHLWLAVYGATDTTALHAWLASEGELSHSLEVAQVRVSHFKTRKTL